MTSRRGHCAASRGRLTRLAIFCCLMLLLAPLAGTVEGVTARVPVDQRTYPAVPGITITQGQSLTITATGTACYDTDCNPPVSPDGSGLGPGGANFKLPGAPQHGLVCGVGGQSPSDLFFVGSSFSGQVTSSGSLFCGMNEMAIPDVWPDNSGSWTVTVTASDPSSWSGWSPVPGGGQAGSQPAAVVDSSGTLHLYIQGADDGLWVNTKSGSTWSGWSAVPGGGKSSSGPAVVLDGSSVRLVVRGLDDGIWTALADDPQWTALGGTTNHSPAAVMEGSTLHIFVRGTDGALYLNSRTAESRGSDSKQSEE